MPLTFCQDLKTRGLLPVKVLLFIQAAGDMAVYPFLTLHMKYLGITVTEIGIQFALSPIATLLATPLVGLLADKIGNFKLMLSISLLLVAGLSQLFLLVPPAIDHVNVPTGQATLSCSSNRNVTIDVPLNITRLSSLYNTTDSAGLKVSLKHCFWTCRDPAESQVCFSSSPGKQKCVNLNTTEKILAHINRHVGEDNKWIVNRPKFEDVQYDDVLCETDDAFCTGNCMFRLEETAVVDPVRHKVTFWTYLALRILLIVIIATEMSLLKAACLTMVDKYESEYGFQRIWPNIAACITPLVTGLLMDRLQNGEIEDYSPCFYIFGGMKLLMAIVTYFADLSAKPPTLDIWKNVVLLVKNPEVCVLLIYCTFVGSCWGYLETFLFWFLETLGASKMLMGMTFTIGSAAGIIPSIYAGALERKIGHIPIISIGLFAYAVRFLGYTFITNAYYALFFEALECLTMSLMLITITTYANQLASVQLVATMQATWAALHFAVGRALGSVVGGFMIDSLGSVATYRIYALKCVFMGVAYLLLYFFWLRRRKSKQEDITKSDHEKCERFTSKEDIFEKNGIDPNIIKEKEKNMESTKPKQEDESNRFSDETSRTMENDGNLKEKSNISEDVVQNSSVKAGKDNSAFQLNEGQEKDHQS